MSKKYVVIKDFCDLQDNNHIYRAGDFYPRSKTKLDQKRAEELSSTKNIRKEVLIVEVVSTESYPKSVGGGYYLLSNGEKVRGKKKAKEEEEKLRG